MKPEDQARRIIERIEATGVRLYVDCGVAIATRPGPQPTRAQMVALLAHRDAIEALLEERSRRAAPGLEGLDCCECSVRWATDHLRLTRRPRAL